MNFFFTSLFSHFQVNHVFYCLFISNKIFKLVLSYLHLSIDFLSSHSLTNYLFPSEDIFIACCLLNIYLHAFSRCFRLVYYSQDIISSYCLIYTYILLTKQHHLFLPSSKPLKRLNFSPCAFKGETDRDSN